MRQNGPKSKSQAIATISIEISVENGDWPETAELVRIARSAVDAAAVAVGPLSGKSELSIVFTDDTRIRALNAGWRGKDKPTNVLSFPAFSYRRGDPLPPMLGDIVLAFETVRDEAALEAKPFQHHITHLLVHGFLHLLGYDHETEADAEEMEAAERGILAALAIPDPYA